MTAQARQQAEEVEESGGDQRAAVLDALPAHVALLDAAGRIVVVNAGWLRFGQANGLRHAGGAVGVDYLEVCERAADCAEAARAAAGLRRVLAGRCATFTLDYPCHTPSAQHWFRLVAAPMSGGGAVVMHVDTTEQHRAEQSARATADLLGAVIACTSNPVFVKDRDGRYLLVNEATCAVMGRSTVEVVGHTDAEIFPPAVADALVANDREVIAAGRTLTREEQVPAPDDTGGHWYLSTKAPLRDERGSVSGVVGVAHEITARKQAEEEIRRLNAELEQRVAQRTAALEAANHELESFSYSVSHDLRAPLRAIDGFSQALLEDHAAQLDAAGLAYLERVRNAAQRMGRLIDDLLGLARLGRQSMDPQPLDVGALAREVLDDLCAQRPRPGLTVAIGERLWALADRRLLQAVLVNLLDNSLKYSAPRPAPQVAVGGERRGDLLACWVRDNGVGFDPAYVDKLFRPFQRLHAADQFDGTGVGLATVRHIVARHGGSVWAESTPGAGATFWFTLPAADPPAG